MAVIESKGDGFALHNGVKLPKLPNNKYSHACIVDLGGKGTNYVLIFSSAPYKWDTSSSTIYYPAHARDTWVYKRSSSTDWVAQNVNQDVEEGPAPAAQKPIWSNYDILNTSDNTTYLAASEPISLDGMNVIEWDGDTTGLEVTEYYYYFVSPATNIDVSRQCVVRNTRSDGAFQVKQTTPKGSDGYYLVGQDARCVTAASEDNLTTGIALGSRTMAYVSVFAYYPIAEEQPEIDRGTLLILYRMFSPVIFHALTGKTHWSD